MENRMKTFVHLTNASAAASINREGLRCFLDEHVGAKELTIGKVVNFVTPDKVGKILYYFTQMGLCDEEPFVVVFREDPTRIKKLHHKENGFVWFISEHDIPRCQIERIVPITEYLTMAKEESDSHSRWKIWKWLNSREG